MPRGPFQGTWRPGIRPTVVQSPDAIVFINGEADILGCGQCRKRFDWNRYITSVQVDLNVDSAPGSASVNMSIPRHSVDEFYFDGNPLITPMMEIEIYAKGYYLIEGLPQYYPIFWGLVTEVSDSYSGGEHSFSINCADILKWWELCQMNINPALTHASGQAGRNLFGNVFFGANPYDIIWTLAQQSFGDVVVGSGSLVSLYKENNQRETFSRSLGDIMTYWQQRFGKIRNNLLLYGTSGNLVRGDVLHAQFVRQGGQKKVQKKASQNAFASQAVRQANGGADGGQMVYDPTDKNVTAFRTQFMNAGQVNFFSSEYQTKLEIANAAKEHIGFEFFMDVTGEIVFKPPFYNLDILSNKPVSWIQDIDIIDWDLSESEAEVFTQVQIQGSFGGNVDYGFSEDVTPFTSVTDYHLLRKYGWRTTTYNSEFLGSPLLMFYVGLDVLDRMNSKRFRGTVNIPMRAELRLGFPIYLAPKDQVWYVNGLSHNLTFGGRAQTTITLTAKRDKFIAPKGIGTINLTGFDGGPPPKDGKTGGDIFGKGKRTVTIRQLAKSGSFKIDVGDAAQIPQTNAPTNPGQANPYEPFVLRHPKTGRIVGYPNVVMAYTRPFFDPPDELLDRSQGKGGGRGNGAVPAGLKNAGSAQALKDATAQILKSQRERGRLAQTATDESVVRDKHFTNRYTYGLNSAGVYTYLHDQSGLLDEIIFLPAKNIEVNDAMFDDVTQIKPQSKKKAKQAKQFQSGMIRPVSDERGFEVVGHYRYGRGVKLRDGSLIIVKGAKNSRATIGVQTALAGGLIEMLQAQSSGIGTITSPYENPADVVANLQPEDLQTAAVKTPEGQPPKFTNTGTNFLQVAPLGSAENQGLDASVEAAQFSRALTLAEMAAREDFDAGPECVCLLGRPDLNFINVGYQVKVLRGTGPDTTTVQAGTTTVELEATQATIKENDDQLAATLAAINQTADDKIKGYQREAESLNNDPTFLRDGKLIESAAVRIFDIQVEIQAIEDQRAADLAKAQIASDEARAKIIADAGVDQGVIDEQQQAIEDGHPIANATIALTRQQLEGRVNGFLVNLFTALDDGHHELEAALRGDLATRQNPIDVPPDVVRFGPGGSDDNFAPPFGALGRARGGDPEALAIIGQTAVEDIENSWDNFSKGIQSVGERTLLEGQINRLNEKIAELADEKSTLQQVTAKGGPPPSGGGSDTGASGDNVGFTATGLFVTAGGAESRCKDILKEIADLEKDLGDKQHKLDVLNQEFPP